MEQQFSEGHRKAIFEVLMDAQDHEMTVAQSRHFVAERLRGD
jgi:hypothetical protein